MEPGLPQHGPRELGWLGSFELALLRAEGQRQQQLLLFSAPREERPRMEPALQQRGARRGIPQGRAQTGSTFQHC